MAKRNHSKADLLEEAGSATTSAARLQVLIQKEPTLGRIIASNPSASWKLLDQLALKHPAEVLANPLLLLRSLEAGGAYSQFSLRALLCLCLASDQSTHQDLLVATRSCLGRGISHFQDQLDNLEDQDEVDLSCTWIHQRIFTIPEGVRGGLIPLPISFVMVVRCNMTGRGKASGGSLPMLKRRQESSDEHVSAFSLFLNRAASGQLGTCVWHQITLEDTGSHNVILKGLDLPGDFFVDDINLQLLEPPDGDHTDNGRVLLEFAYTFGGQDSPIEIKGKRVTIPLEYTNECDHDYGLDMGILSGLEGFYSDLPMSLRTAEWSDRLARLLLEH